MHRTSTTHLSDSLERVIELDARLNDVEWMPIEEKIQLLLVGSVFMQDIIDETTIEELTEDEYKMVLVVIERLNAVVENAMLNNNDTENGC
tara:strand:+ start:200 stop:472 length:273 start_codon:yes stop_codon:yes gene_type:complete